MEGASSDNDKTVVYTSKLPAGVSRILDLLISRLLTGRIVLSEATLAHVMSRVRHSWKYATARELWRGRHPKGRMMAEMPLVSLTVTHHNIRRLSLSLLYMENVAEIVGCFLLGV
jgi:hypothetical protein